MRVFLLLSIRHLYHYYAVAIIRTFMLTVLLDFRPVAGKNAGLLGGRNDRYKILTEQP